jgi:hypothetical protein
MINVAPLTAVGYDASLAPDRVQVTTGSGVEFAPRIDVTRIKAMGQERAHFPVLAHTLPPSASVDGLLGLDFLRGQVVNIDFRKGRISFTRSKQTTRLSGLSNREVTALRQPLAGLSA